MEETLYELKPYVLALIGGGSAIFAPNELGQFWGVVLLATTFCIGYLRWQYRSRCN